MGDIVIIGGGFAGLEAARILSKNRARLGGRRILLVDAKRTFDFLPLLPDVAGYRVGKKHVVLDLADYLGKLGVNFQQDEVMAMDTDAKEIHLKNGNVLAYEFLILSCGSVTNFYGLKEVERRSLKLDTAEDAGGIGNSVTTYPGKKILIIGGGYTGIGTATNLAVLLQRRKIKKYNISVVEKTEDILGPLPEWIKDYCRLNLCRLRINVYPGCSIQTITDQSVELSNGLIFDDYLVVWAAGVQTPAFVRELKFDKDNQGRLIVNKHMLFQDQCFAVGDAASFKHKTRPLRMAVQFSIAQAQVAAKNIVRLIAGKKLVVYQPVDLGYLIPMANKKACGEVLFFRVWGILGWFCHYVTCLYRSLSARNRWGVFSSAFLNITR